MALLLCLVFSFGFLALRFLVIELLHVFEILGVKLILSRILVPLAFFMDGLEELLLVHDHVLDNTPEAHHWVD